MASKSTAGATSDRRVPTTMTTNLHPAVAAYLADSAAMGLRPYVDLAPADARTQFATVMAARLGADHRPRPMAEVVDRTVAVDGRDIPLRLYRPSTSTSNSPVMPTVVFFHGGGWVIGDLDTHDALCRRIADGLPAVVVAVDYCRAPEAPFPAPVEDAAAATRWVAAHVAELGGDPDALVVAGDSAGAAMATVVARRARDTGTPRLAAQLLLYPVTDLTMSHPSYVEMGTGYGLTAETMAWFIDHYAGPVEDPDASPMAAEDLAGLPAAVVTTADHDPLRDEGDAYARRLADAGVPTVHHRHEGLIHAYALMETVPIAMEAITDDLSALRGVLAA